MKISIITLFPEMFSSVFNLSIIRRAQEEGVILLNFVNLRDFGIGKHKTVDDTPYGGGVGMVLKVEVVHKAIEATKTHNGVEKVVLLDPKGSVYQQETVETFSKLNHLILICGHYEGFDERIRSFVDCEVSIGDYVLSGGEIAAMVVVDSVVRLVPGVLKKNEASSIESFSKVANARLLEYPQYTRPREYEGMVVPDVLVSGNQKAIDEFRMKESVMLTQKRRGRKNTQ